jgi:hypothetical protein
MSHLTEGNSMSVLAATRELISLHRIEELVAERLAASRCCSGVALEAIYRHRDDRTGCNWDASYWQDDSGTVLPCRASVFEEIELLRERFNLA